MRRSVLVAVMATALAAGCSRHEETQAPRKKPPAQLQLYGEELFNERCRDCHVVRDKGGAVGPELTHVGRARDRAFLERVIREPAKIYPGTAMPPYDTFSKKQIDSLVDYLSGLK